MHATIRPYVTTGLALVGAGVIAVTPLASTPVQSQAHSPAVPVSQSAAVKLMAMQQSVPEVYADVFQRATQNAQLLATAYAEDPAPILSAILGNFGNGGTKAELTLVGSDQSTTPIGGVINLLSNPQFAIGLTLTMVGPVISTVGATGVAIQSVVQALGTGDVNAVVTALAIAPATVLDGLLNGGYGPDLSPLLQLGTDTGGADPNFVAPRRVLAGGLLSPPAGLTSVDPRSDALDDGGRILAGPIGGFQQARVAVARAISPQQRYIAASDATLASSKTVSANTNGARALGSRVGAQRLSKATERIGKHRAENASKASA